MTDEQKFSLKPVVDTTGARAGFGELKQEARDTAQAMASAGQQASRGIDAIGESAKASASQMERAERSIIASIRRQAAEQQRAVALTEAGGQKNAAYFESIARQRGISPEALRPYLAELERVQRLQQQVTGQLGTMGVSAAQTAAALRQVPAQVTDIFTSLAAGQAPLTVLLQQGGQLKDAFGGIGAATRALGGYVAGLVNPFTIAAAAATAVGVAFYQGRSEAEEFRKQIILSGNAAGVTADQLAGMAQRVSGVVGTQGKAAEVLAMLVSTGRVSGAALEQSAASIVAFAKASGASVSSLVDNMAMLGKTPAEGLMKLNEQFNFLTQATYEQVLALEKQGKADEAAAAAQRAYSDMMAERSAAVRDNLGYLERGWNSVAEAAKDAWSFMAGIGREQSVADALKDAEKDLDRLKKYGNLVNSDVFTLLFGQSQQALAEQMQGKLELEQQFQKAAQQEAQRQQQRRQIENAAIASTKEIEALREANRTSAERKAAALAKYDSNLANIERANKNSPILDPQRIASDKAAIAAQFDKEALRDQKRAADEAARSLERSIGLFRDLTNEGSGLSASFNEQVESLQLGLKRGAYSVDQYTDAYIKLIAKQPAAVAVMRQQAEEEKRRYDDNTRAAREFYAVLEAEAQAAQRSAKAAAERVQSLEDEEAALKVAAEGNISLAEAIERVHMARLQADLASAQASGKDEAARAMQQEIEMLEKLAGLRGRKDERTKADEAFKDLMGASIGTDFAAGFDKASQSLGSFVETFGKLVEQQEKYKLARQAQGKTNKEINELEETFFRYQINSYATLAGAARGFLSEKTAGYKVLMAAEQGLRALELASSISRIAAKAAEGQALAAVGVANQASGDPYTAFPRMAAMAGIMAALGFAVGGFGGGGGGGFAPTNTGTGTVLGDPAAQSESIARALDKLTDVDTLTMRYSAGMLASLQNIESNIGGLATLLIQSGQLDPAASGIREGFEQNSIGKALSSRIGGAQIGSMIGGAFFGPLGVLAGGLLGGLLNPLSGLLGGLFGTKTTIQGQGFAAGRQSISDIMAGGFQASYYTDVEKKKKTLGITTDTDRYSIYRDADALLESQITKVFAGFSDALLAAADPLGMALDTVQGRINAFVVDIGRVDLRGLSGEQLQERLSAVFSAAGDRLATVALPGFDRFQKVGEGYLQTVIRVATGTEEAGTALRRLGVSAVGLTAVVNAQGDIGAELVRQSILAVEGLTGVKDIIKTLQGDASEVASTYRELKDISGSLGLLGLDAAAVGRSLIEGAGGLQELADAVAAFEEGFLSSNDQVTVKARRLAEEFERLGFVMPASSDAFVQLVKGIDTSTNAGQLLLGGVLGLSDGFASLLSAIKSVGSGIEDEINRIKGLSTTGSASTMGLAELQADFAIKTAQARAGNQAAIDALPKISQALLKVAESTAGSSLDVAAVQARTLASLEETLRAIGDPTKRIPGYATGGLFGGGWRIVGETGPELEATGPARIFSSGDTARIMSAASGGANDRVLRELQGTVQQQIEALREEMRVGLAVVARGTNDTAQTLRDVTQDGTRISVITT